MQILSTTKFPNIHFTADRMTDEEGEYTKRTYFHRMGPLFKMLKVLTEINEAGEYIGYLPLTDQTTDTHVRFRVL